MWKKTLRALGWVFLSILLLITAVITVAVNYLKPERLTPIIEKIADKNINGTLRAERIEISFWKTFPKFRLDVSRLTVLTDAFEGLPDSVSSRLPAYADTLLTINRLNGAVNIPQLISGTLHLYDITIDRPAFNLVQATPSSSSLDIFPKSDDSKDKESAILIPKIEMETFRIEGGFPIRYVSLPDSVDSRLLLSTTSLDGNSAPVYKLDIAGLTSLSIPDLTINELGLGLGGDVTWSPSMPMKASLDKFVIRAGDVSLNLSAKVDFKDSIRVESLDASIPLTPFKEIVALVPSELRGELGKIDADFSISSEAALTRPYTIGTDSIPSLSFSIKIPRGSAKYDRMSLDILEADISADIDGLNPDRSTIDIHRLKAQGEGMGFLLSATVTDIISNPYIKGTFRGGLSMAKLPRILLDKFPGTIKGLLKADCDFSLRRSYLDKENFHRVLLTGDATLTNLDVNLPEAPIHIYSREMSLHLGTNTSFTRMEATTDSLLTASLKIDTLSCLIPGMEMQGKGLKMGVGCKNTASSTDTTLINPIGGRIMAERLMLRSTEDSVRVRLRNAMVGTSLTRYKDDAAKPRLHLDIGAERAIYGDRLSRASLRNAVAVLTIHPSAPPKLSRRRQARLDSLMTLYPDLPEDSVRRMEARMAYERRRARMAKADTTGREVLDIEVDNTLKKLLVLWRAEGSLRAERARVFSPLFPLRNRMSDLDMRFSSDSVIINGTRLNVGHSDFLVDGIVSNITKALTSSTGRQPIVANFRLSSDSIDINEIAAAVFAGAAFAEKDDGVLQLAAPDDIGNDENIENKVAQISADTASVLVIPSNIEAALNVNARNIIYDNLVFHDFKGILNIYRGALNLNQLRAKTDIGSVDLNALYSAPSKNDASFAFGLMVNEFHIGEFLKLVPAIDSLMPLLQGIDGIINADIAATTKIDSAMNLDIPSLKAAVKISGDSLRVIDDETFRTIGKWLMFKHKERNVIDSMTVEMIVEDSRLQLFPFMFNLDRYKLGVTGSNDMAMNLNYHVAVLKSPLPFKFGINITGNPDKMKIRLGGAKFNEKNMSKTVSIADTTRINLVREISNIFRRGARNARVRTLDFSASQAMHPMPAGSTGADTISRSDSLYFIKEGLIAAPDTVAPRQDLPVKEQNKRKK